MPSGGPDTGRPRNCTSPALGGIKPAMICSNVDLPQPEGPRIARNSPGSTSRPMSRSASSSPPPLLTKVRETWFRRMASPWAGSACDGGCGGALIRTALI